MSSSIENLILSILQQEIDKSIKIEKQKMLGGGCINNAMHLKTSHGDFFLKYNQNCPPDLFLREAESLQELAKPDSGLQIPKVFAATELHEQQPAVLLTEYLPSGSGGKKQDETLAHGLATIHKYSAEKYGFYHDNYCGATEQNNQWNHNWIDFFANQRIGYLVKLIAKDRQLSNMDHDIYEKLIDKLPDLLTHEVYPSLVHGDLWSGNYMNTSNGPAIIDPACSYSDREFDLAITNMFGGFSEIFWSAYHEAYPLQPGWKERNNLYMLYHYLNHYYLFGGAYGQQALQIAKNFI